MRAAPGRMPTLFLAHGAPMLLDDAVWVAELAALAAALPRPRAILVVSAHWEAEPIGLSATTSIPLVYDFQGFPDRFYRLTYPSPGAPDLAARVQELLAAAGEPSAVDPTRGLDHGTWVPLLAMFPAADVPVMQVALPSLDRARLLRMGLALAPLRDEGVLVVGSGFVTHNLRQRTAEPAPWAVAFDTWVAEAVARGDLDALVRMDGPGAAQSHPRSEHYAPMVVAAAAGAGDPVRTPISGWWMGSFSKRTVVWG